MIYYFLFVIFFLFVVFPNIWEKLNITKMFLIYLLYFQIFLKLIFIWRDLFLIIFIFIYIIIFKIILNTSENKMKIMKIYFQKINIQNIFSIFLTKKINF